MSIPFAPIPKVLSAGLPAFSLGSFNDRVSTTNFYVKQSAETSGVITVTGVVWKGPIPVDGQLITTSTLSNVPNLVNAVISAVTIDAVSGAGTITYADVDYVAPQTLSVTAVVSDTDNSNPTTQLDLTFSTASPIPVAGQTIAFAADAFLVEVLAITAVISDIANSAPTTQLDLTFTTASPAPTAGQTITFAANAFGGSDPARILNGHTVVIDGTTPPTSTSATVDFANSGTIIGSPGTANGTLKDPAAILNGQTVVIDGATPPTATAAVVDFNNSGTITGIPGTASATLSAIDPDATTAPDFSLALIPQQVQLVPSAVSTATLYGVPFAIPAISGASNNRSIAWNNYVDDLDATVSSVEFDLMGSLDGVNFTLIDKSTTANEQRTFTPVSQLNFCQVNAIITFSQGDNHKNPLVAASLAI